ncbi:MAG: 2-amino-4-hydroxy-6-hydroxymethyldihydropteridine diphosphokinase [Gammaproteobacteria bacterium]|nr:2-amino-4-hydroxy-6-hydroxymethyldihydropteridine diphosphokinase [Gammaproteobacteria bacterium]
MSAPVDAFVGLGSNLDDPARQVRAAFAELDTIDATRLVAASPLYRSAPVGPADQPEYVNAVAWLHTGLEPDPLLDALQSIETRHGRVRGQHWGPRTLDLDLLLYADRRIDTRRLVVPHPQMHQRAFVLVPLHDIAPDTFLPGLGPLETWMNRVDRAGLRADPPAGRD